MKQNDIEKLKLRAKTKSDGVFSFKGSPYAVKDSRLVLIAERKKLYQITHGFMVSIGEVEHPYDAVNKLKQLLKKL